MKLLSKMHQNTMNLEFGGFGVLLFLCLSLLSAPTTGLAQSFNSAPNFQGQNPQFQQGSQGSAQGNGLPTPLVDPPPGDNALQTLDPLPQSAANAGGNNSNNFDFSGNSGRSSLGATQGSFSSAPTIFGDFFGGATSAFGGSQHVTRFFTGPGTTLATNPDLIIGIENGVDTLPNDVFTTGSGIDASGDGFSDTFTILEPLPNSDAPTSPGAGFVYDPASGSAVFVGNSGGQAPIDGIFTDGQNWFVSYDYVASLSGPGSIKPVPGPGVATRRVKVAENFSPEVRDRAFVNYSFFNDAFGGLGDISRYIVGFERVLFEDLISIEARLPMAGTYGSKQTIGQSENRNYELGNAALIGKGVLWRGRNYVWSGGIGIGLPTADDTVLRSGNRDVLVVENETIHLFPFTSLLYRHNRDWFFQGVMQLDVATNGDTVKGDLTGRSLPILGKFNDSTLMSLDVSATRSVYRNRCAASFLREVMLNSELHYTGTMQSSDFVSGGGINYTNIARNLNILNATVGAHFVLANNLVVSPAMSVPMRDGLDEQFDYEAIVQVNYLR